MSIKLVQEFNLKFDLPVGDDDLLTQDFCLQQYRLEFLQEELLEFDHALANSRRVDAFDALLDLVYVAMGTALYMGITPTMWNDGMDAVHRANMSKAKGAGHRRGKAEKMVKPAGWVGPEETLKEILK